MLLFISFISSKEKKLILKGGLKKERGENSLESIKEDEEENKNWEEMNFLEKLDYVFEIPFDWIRKITIPITESDKFDP